MDFACLMFEKTILAIFGRGCDSMWEATLLPAYVKLGFVFRVSGLILRY
jgi:hypothetical protein